MDSGDDVFVLMIDAAVMWKPEIRTFFLAGIDKDGVTLARIQQGLRFRTPLVLVPARCRRQTRQFCVLVLVCWSPEAFSLSAPNAVDARMC